jgi:uncharacterized protein (TIGR03437 family)
MTLALLHIAAGNLAFAVSDGAPAGASGAPGEFTCTSCHAGAANSGQGRVRIELPGGEVYSPGQKVRMKVVIEDPSAIRWGFQLTARSAANESRSLGRLEAADNTAEVLSQGEMQWITHTLAGTRRGTRSPVTFEFDWTAPANDAAPVVFYAAANAANGNGAPTGDSIYTTSLRATAGSGGGARPSFTSSAVTEAFTRKAGMSPGSWVTITGTDLAARAVQWSPAAGRPLDTRLGGVTVKINDVPAALSSVSPTSIMLLVPAATPVGNVPVVIERDGTAGEVVSVAVSAAVPAIQSVADPNTAGRFWAAATPAGAGTSLSLVNPKGWVLNKPEIDSRAVRGPFPGEEIDLYATGLGPASETPTDRLFSGSFPVANMPKVRFGEVTVDAASAALVSPGLYVVRVKVPESLAAGDVAVTLDVNGSTSAASVMMFVQAAQ